MALLALDDFEFGPNGSDNEVYLAATSPADGAYVTAAGKFKDGEFGYEIAGNDQFVGYSIPASAEIYLSVWLVPNGNNTGKEIVWKSTGVELGSLRWDGTLYHVHVGTGGATANGTTAVAAFGSGGVLKNYQLRIKIHNSTGAVQFKLTDVMEIDHNTADTQPGAETTINEIYFGNQVIIDNVWINDTVGTENNAWPGEVRLWSDRPISDSTTNNDFVGTTAGIKANLINGDIDESSFVSSAVVGDLQGFAYQAPCVPAGSTIKSLSIIDLPYKVNAGTLKQGLYIGGTAYPSASKELADAVITGSARAEHFELNPDTTVAWVTTDNPEGYLEHDT